MPKRGVSTVWGNAINHSVWHTILPSSSSSSSLQVRPQGCAKLMTSCCSSQLLVSFAVGGCDTVSFMASTSPSQILRKTPDVLRSSLAPIQRFAISRLAQSCGTGNQQATSFSLPRGSGSHRRPTMSWSSHMEHKSSTIYGQCPKCRFAVLFTGKAVRLRCCYYHD